MINAVFVKENLKVEEGKYKIDLKNKKDVKDVLD